MKRFFDLRFVIGLFFLIMGIMMLGHSLLANTEGEHNPEINLYSSILFLVFALLMLYLSTKKLEE